VIRLTLSSNSSPQLTAYGKCSAAVSHSAFRSEVADRRRLELVLAALIVTAMLALFLPPICWPRRARGVALWQAALVKRAMASLRSSSGNAAYCWHFGGNRIISAA